MRKNMEKLTSKNVQQWQDAFNDGILKITEKIDGAYGKIRIYGGDVSLESARSGEIFNPVDFLNFAHDNGKPFRFASQYANLLLALQDFVIKTTLIDEFNDEYDFECEIMFRELAKETVDGLVFVNVPYTQSFLSEKPFTLFIRGDVKINESFNNHCKLINFRSIPKFYYSMPTNNLMSLLEDCCTQNSVKEGLVLHNPTTNESVKYQVPEFAKIVSKAK